jgi:hypothetical protein
MNPQISQITQIKKTQYFLWRLSAPVNPWPRP